MWWQRVSFLTIRMVHNHMSDATHRHIIYVPSVKNQYKRVVFGYMDIFTNSHLCQFIEIVQKIINWYMKNGK